MSPEGASAPSHSLSETMIIRSSQIREGLQTIDYRKEQVVFTHAQRIDPVLAECQESRESGSEGWSANRTMQRIASIPAAVFVQHPEFVHEPSLITKWLQTDEGRPYRTTRGGL